MLALNQTFDDRRLIRVLVVPIGNNSLFNEQFQVVSSLRALNYYDLSRPQQTKIQSSFKFLTWNTGQLLFEYLRYDRAASGPSDLDDFQSSKRILMIMGLMNYDEYREQRSKRSLDEEMDLFARRYPSIGVKRVFVFNYLFDTSERALRDLKGDNQSLVIFPPDGACEGGSMIDVHFKEVMCLAAVAIVQQLERQMEVCEESKSKGTLPSDPSLTTAHDDRDDIIIGKENQASAAATASYLRNKKLFKKRPAGRIRKWMGDLSMQVCSPIDAVENYVAAIAELRSQGDSMWLAGALDGYSSAIITLKEMGLQLDEIIGKDLRTITQPVIADDMDDEIDFLDNVYILAEERAAEALSIYSSCIVLKTLEVECSLRMARMLEMAPPFYMKDQKVLEYILRAMNVPGLNSQQQIECALEGALICHRMGMRRKYCLLVYISALMTAEMGNYDAAKSLIDEVVNKINIPVEESQRFGDQGGEAWDSLVISLLTDGVFLSQESTNPAFSARLLVQLIGAFSRSEVKHGALQRIMSKYNRKLLGLEKFVKRKKSVQPLPMPPQPGSSLTEDSLRKLQDTTSVFPSPPPSQRVASQTPTGSDRVTPVNLAKTKGFALTDSSSVQSSSRLIRPISWGGATVSGDIDGLRRRLSSFIPASGARGDPASSSNGAQKRSDTSSIEAEDTKIMKSSLKGSTPGRSTRKIVAMAIPEPSLNRRLLPTQNRHQGRSEASLSNNLLRHLIGDSAAHDLDSSDAIVEELGDKFHLIDLTHARDILSVVTSALKTQAVPPDMQESAVNMLRRAAHGITQPMFVSMPLSVISLQPMHLYHPFKPLRFVHKVLNDIKGAIIKQTSNHKDDSMAGASVSMPGKTTFYYDPFAARRDRSKAVVNEEMLWPTGRNCSLLLRVSNPLSVPLLLERVVPVLQGDGEMIAFPVDAEIPPKTNFFFLELPVAAFGKGTLRVEGLKLNIGNLVQFIPIDKNGLAAPSPKTAFDCGGLEVTRTDPRVMATNEVQVVVADFDLAVKASWDPSIHGKAQCASTGTIESEIELLPGELRSEKLLIYIDKTALNNATSERDEETEFDIQIICTTFEDNSGGSTVPAGKSVVLNEFHLLRTTEHRGPRRSAAVAATATAAAAGTGSVSVISRSEVRNLEERQRSEGGGAIIEVDLEFCYDKRIGAIELEMQIVPLGSRHLRALRGLWSGDRSSHLASPAPTATPAPDEAIWDSIIFKKVVLRLNLMQRDALLIQSLSLQHPVPRGLCDSLSQLLTSDWGRADREQSESPQHGKKDCPSQGVARCLSRSPYLGVQIENQLSYPVLVGLDDSLLRAAEIERDCFPPVQALSRECIWKIPARQVSVITLKYPENSDFQESISLAWAARDGESARRSGKLLLRTAPAGTHTPLSNLPTQISLSNIEQFYLSLSTCFSVNVNSKSSSRLCSPVAVQVHRNRFVEVDIYCTLSLISSAKIEGNPFYEMLVAIDELEGENKESEGSGWAVSGKLRGAVSFSDAVSGKTVLRTFHRRIQICFLRQGQFSIRALLCQIKSRSDLSAREFSSAHAQLSQESVALARSVYDDYSSSIVPEAVVASSSSSSMGKGQSSLVWWVSPHDTLNVLVEE